MAKFYIIVEGKADAGFLRDYICFRSKTDIDKDTPLEKELKTTEHTIKIIAIGGYSKIEKLSSKIKEAIDAEYKILLIQDADNETKDPQNGGKVRRIQYLEGQMKNLSATDYDIFLFPDNQNDGDLETLLLSITNAEKYQAATNCYEKYANCVSLITNNELIKNELLEDKNKVFNYFRIYYDMEMAKEEKRKYEQTYWDLNSANLNPLDSFLSKQLQL